MVPQKFITQSTRETYLLGQRLGKILQKPAILCLYGELGSGKTTFIQGLAAGLGIKKRIISPTFVFIRSYKIRIKNQELRIKEEKPLNSFYHIDLYRIKSPTDARSLGIGEILKEENCVIAIEWAEKIREILPTKRIEIYFKYLGTNKREIGLVIPDYPQINI